MPQAQRDHVDKMTNDVKDALTIVAKLPPEVAENASLAARASMISSYAQGMSKDQVDAQVNSVVKPYVANPGSFNRVLGDLDAAYIEKVKGDVKAVVAPRLSPPYTDAVVFTAGLATQKILEIEDEPSSLSDNDLSDTVVSSLTDQFKDLPPRTDPNSPFHKDVITVIADAPPVQASTASAPPALQVNPNVDSTVNADGSITERSFGSNGQVITRTRYPGGPADPPWDDANQPQPTASSGATQLDVLEEDLNAGQNNNSGNTKNRTGSDDGKKDKDKQDNNGDGGGNSNNHSSGGHHQK